MPLANPPANTTTLKCTLNISTRVQEKRPHRPHIIPKKIVYLEEDLEGIMSWLQCKTYLLPKAFRLAYFIGIPIGVGGLASFSYFMWYLSTVPVNDQGSCRLVACLFAGLTVWCAYSAFCNLKIINMRYEIVNDVAINYYGKDSIQIPLNADVWKTELCLPLAVAKGTYRIDYLLISDKTYKLNRRATERGIRVLQDLWKSGVVLLPGGVSLKAPSLEGK